MTRASISEFASALEAFRGAGLEVLITELDLDVLPRDVDSMGADLNVNAELSAAVDPYRECVPADADARIAAQWSGLFRTFVQYADIISSVTLWGLDGGQSWLNNWPVQGRTNYPLLLDRQLQPKSAYQSVLEQADAP